MKSEGKRGSVSGQGPQPGQNLVKPDLTGAAAANFEKQIDVRLRCLEFIVTNSDLSLDFKQLDVLWKMLYDVAFTANERQRFLAWISNAVAVRSGGVVKYALYDCCLFLLCSMS